MVLLKNIQNHNWNYKINVWLIILIQKHSQFMLIKQDFKTRRIVLITAEISSNRLQISVQLMQSVAEAQWWRVRAKATPLEQKNVSGYVCNHGSPSGERDTASPRGRYGERPQRDSV